MLSLWRTEKVAFALQLLVYDLSGIRHSLSLLTSSSRRDAFRDNALHMCVQNCLALIEEFVPTRLGRMETRPVHSSS